MNPLRAEQANQHEAMQLTMSSDNRVQELIERIRSRARACLLAARVCLLALLIAFIVGVLIFLWANKIVEVPVSLHSPSNIAVSNNSEPVTINIDQTLSKETADAVLNADWRRRVLNQVSALAARLGVVCILIFVMQFVMRLFRYYHATHLFFPCTSGSVVY
jgi:hypothetical protein